MTARLIKRLLIGIVLLCLAALAGFRIHEAYQKKNSAQAGPAGGPPRGPGGRAGARVVSVGMEHAKLGSVDEVILLTGALKPKEQVDVTSKATGRLETIHVYIGDQIKAGSLIAELDDDELQQQVKRAEAVIAVSRASSAQRKAELANAQADLERSKNLLEEGLIPRRDFDARQTAHQVVQAQLQLARAQEEQALAELNELKIRLQQTKIYAPMAGHVARRYVDVGALVNPSTPVINLVNLSTMVTAANVPERDIAKLRVGNRASVHVDAFGDKEFQGRVARISPVLDPATRSGLVEVEIPNPNGGLKAEMFARVTLDLSSTREAVLIPREALVYRGQQPGVYVLENKRPTFRLIETGNTRGEQVEVLANLKPGEPIITRGATMLSEGDQIRIIGAEGEGARPGRRPPT